MKNLILILAIFSSSQVFARLTEDALPQKTEASSVDMETCVTGDCPKARFNRPLTEDRASVRNLANRLNSDPKGKPPPELDSAKTADDKK